MRSRLVLLSTLLILCSVGIPSVLAAPTLAIQKTWGGPGDDEGSGIALDTSGNIFVAGITSSYGTGNVSAVLLKLSPTGVIDWQRVYSRGQATYGLGIAADSLGNIYETGFATPRPASGVDGLLLKLNSSGGLVWQKEWNGSDVNVGLRVKLDQSGNVYVVGGNATYDGGSFGSSCFPIIICGAVILKFSPNGNLIWQKTWKDSNRDGFWDLEFDSSGNIYISGASNATGHGGALLLKLNSTGTPIWSRVYTGAQGNGIALDSAGNIYQTGFAGSGAGFGDAMILKYDGAGNLVWQRTWGGSDLDWGSHVAVNATGTVFVTGRSDSYSKGSFLLVLDSQGTFRGIWTWGSNGSATGQALDSDITLDRFGNPLLTGYVASPAPYPLGSGNRTLGKPRVTPFLGSGCCFQTSSFTTYAANGALNSPNGSLTYAGNADIFIFDFNSSSIRATILSPIAILLLSAPLSLLLIQRTGILHPRSSRRYGRNQIQDL